MPRQPARFTQADLTRAIKAALAAGLHVTSTRIDSTGAIEVICGNAGEAAKAATPLDEWLSRTSRGEKGKAHAPRHAP